MKPVLFRIFGINVYGYGLMMAIGIASAALLLDYRSKKRGYDEDKILNMTIIAVICGLIGGKVLYIITVLKDFIQNPALIIESLGSGFVVYGSIIGGVLGGYIYCRRSKWNFIKTLDLVIPSLPLGQGFGRIGCLLAGCCYGKPTNSSLGIVFHDSPYAPHGIKLYPTEIYSSIFDFLLMFFLLWYSKKNKQDGRVFAMYVILYSVGRFFVEFLRGDLIRGFVGVLSTSQFISIFTFIIGILFYNIGMKTK